MVDEAVRQSQLHQRHHHAGRRQRLAIGYEQSLAGAASVLKLTYQLSRAWSVVLRGGQVAGLDLSYSRRFDRFGEDSKK